MPMVWPRITFLGWWAALALGQKWRLPRFHSRIAVAAVALVVAGCGQPTVPPSLEVAALSGDRAALMALYESTDGENWEDNTNWGTDEPLWKWYGVRTDGDGRVTGLYLEDNDLSGEIVPELGDLTQLGELYLYFNADLSGEIPAELENTALRSLDISGTSVSGGIPPELGNLETLRDLELWNNPNMSGEIPPELGGLASLEVLRLINIGLTGSIPPDLAALPKLEWLVLPSNNLTGEIPSKLGALPRLEILHLWDNDLSGEVPRTLGGLDEQLKRLDIAGNNLTGEIPRTWLALDLDEFGMSRNRGLCVPNTKAFDVWLDSMKNPLDKYRCEDG